MRALVLGKWALWWSGMLFFAINVPYVYAVTCVPMTGAFYFFTGKSGLLSVLAATDPSGKHKRGMAQGCLPITTVLDLAIAPFQFPSLIPYARQSLRESRKSMRTSAAVRSPETIEALTGKVGKEVLEDWEYDALMEACRIEDSFDEDGVRILIDLFGGTIEARDSDQGLAWLIARQRLSTEDLRRVFEIEKNRGHFENWVKVPRHHRALDELAPHEDTPMDVLQGIVDIEVVGQAMQVARERLLKGEYR